MIFRWVPVFSLGWITGTTRKSAWFLSQTTLSWSSNMILSCSTVSSSRGSSSTMWTAFPMETSASQSAPCSSKCPYVPSCPHEPSCVLMSPCVIRAYHPLLFIKGSKISPPLIISTGGWKRAPEFFFVFFFLEFLALMCHQRFHPCHISKTCSFQRRLPNGFL